MTIHRDRDRNALGYCPSLHLRPIDRTQRLLALIAENVAAGKPDWKGRIFKAGVDAQGGAYATGVLVVITSAAVAVTLAVWRTRSAAAAAAFCLIAVVFAYTTVVNIIERANGVKIAAFFISAIVIVSLPHAPAAHPCLMR